MTAINVEIDIEPTPNPNALKFILNSPIKNHGSSTYRTPMECAENKLAQELFKIRGIDQLHFFENVISVTKFSYEDWENVEKNVSEVLKNEMPAHDPNYEDPNPREERRKNLSPELLEIENILDRTIRPGLQADGGDIEALTYKENILMVKYQGACGTCPSSTTGTLEAIKAILRDEFNPEIEVYIAPES
jgi:Fe-S cluster biogenesis protein NfuA